MNIDNQIADMIAQLTPDELRYMCKLVCLLRFCPGFNEELNGIVPLTSEPISKEQLTAIDLLMDKWLNAEGYADLLRAKLASVGVAV